MHNITYHYRLYPTAKQVKLAWNILSECRWLYNHLLEERKNLWEQNNKSISMYGQISSLTTLKKERPSLGHVHSQVLQNVAVRIDLAFKAFFRRVKVGEKPGYPRFRGPNRYDSFTYPQSGYCIGTDWVYLSKIGKVKAIIHRSIEGKIKTCTIHKTPTDKWYASFSCEVLNSPLPESKEEVGIDVGIESFATFSTGEIVPNPHFFRMGEKELAKAQRRMSKFENSTIERAKSCKVVSHIHERIANRRSNFAHQLSRRIVNEFGTICVEDIRVNRMLHNHCLAKSISDAAWSMFFNFLAYKAANAGRQYIADNPAYTTQDCSRCGHRQKLSLSERVYHCPCCNITLPRDHNASLNILAHGRVSLGIQSVEAVRL